jgi:hypothetical protein
VVEVTDEPLYRDRVYGIDIGEAQLVATIRVPSDRDPARQAEETRSFDTTLFGSEGWGFESLRAHHVPAGQVPHSQA